MATGSSSHVIEAPSFRLMAPPSATCSTDCTHLWYLVGLGQTLFRPIIMRPILVDDGGASCEKAPIVHGEGIEAEKIPQRVTGNVLHVHTSSSHITLPWMILPHWHKALTLHCIRWPTRWGNLSYRLPLLRSWSLYGSHPYPGRSYCSLIILLRTFSRIPRAFMLALALYCFLSSHTVLWVV